jgi:hypothetical protein
MKLISRQEAIQQNLTRYFTGEPCKYGHIAEKLLSNRTCIECQLVRKNIWSNKPNVKQKGFERLKNWDTPHKHLARTRKRQAAKLQRLPKWLTEHDLAVIQAKYSIAAMLTRENGIPYHVDHIIPLQGKKVSGLHTPLNLQVIPGSENVKKSNKHPI